MILGAHDAAYGAIIPYLETYYHVNYTVISLVFLGPIGGYAASALLNNHIHVVYGQRGIAVLMSLAHLIAYSMCFDLAEKVQANG
jgi:fucose permease